MPVDSFEPNPFGLFNMHGNVWEMVEDCYPTGFRKDCDIMADISACSWDNYVTAPTDGSARLFGECKGWMAAVLRGGSWAGTPVLVRSASRVRSDPDERMSHQGFRVVRELEETSDVRPGPNVRQDPHAVRTASRD